jgi:hypothetical protein
MEPNTTSIAINIKANFLGHPSISSQVLMSSVQWNLCLNDPERTARGEADLCWWVDCCLMASLMQGSTTTAALLVLPKLVQSEACDLHSNAKTKNKC